jgi:hypothetical protein
VPPTGDEILSRREDSIQSLRPLALIPLRVSAELVSCGTGPVLWDDVPSVDFQVHVSENPSPKQRTNTSELIKINRINRFDGLTYILLTLPVFSHCGSLSCRSARKLYLGEHQRELTHRPDRLNARFREQSTGLSVKHELKETSEKSGEPSLSPETRKQVRSRFAKVETSFEVLSEARQGYR